MINESQVNPNEVLDENQINLDEVLEDGHGISDNLFPSSSIETDHIDTVCDSIQILSMDDEKKRNSIEEIGKSYFDDEGFQSMGGASIQTEIVLDNLGIPLYPAFNDPQFALSSVKSQCAGIINELKTAYGLNDFSYEHLDEYSGKLMAHLDNENKSDWYDELDDQFVALSGFLDIYGDMKSNSYMISTAATAKSIPELLSDYDFLLELPYFAIDDLDQLPRCKHSSTVLGLLRRPLTALAFWSCSARPKAGYGGIVVSLSTYNQICLIAPLAHCLEIISYTHSLGFLHNWLSLLHSHVDSPSPHNNPLSKNFLPIIVSSLLDSVQILLSP